jgi:hypothetical protein
LPEFPLGTPLTKQIPALIQQSLKLQESFPISVSRLSVRLVFEQIMFFARQFVYEL